MVCIITALQGIPLDPSSIRFLVLVNEIISVSEGPLYVFLGYYAPIISVS